MINEHGRSPPVAAEGTENSVRGWAREVLAAGTNQIPEIPGSPPLRGKDDKNKETKSKKKARRG
jgi:hypothetical protein